MKKLSSCVVAFLMLSISVFAQNHVGVGTTTPIMDLHVRSADSAIALFDNSQTLATSIKSGIYLRTGSYYTGAIKTIGTGVNVSRLGLFSYASGNANALKEYLSIADNGNVGIGNIDPQVQLSFPTTLGKKVSLYRGTNGDAGFGVFGNEFRMHSDYNGADITFGYDDLSNGFTERMRMKGTGEVGIGTNAPAAKLDIVTASGSDGLIVGSSSQKVVVRPGGLFGSVIGTSTGNAFHIMANNSINLTINNSGNVGVGTILPEYKLDVNGRMRVAHTSGNTAGIWFNKSTNEEASFIGQFDDNNFGIYGNGNWRFLFDVADNTMRIGTAQKASGYLLNVGGKIIAEEVRVQLRSAWPDYVFSKNYKLRSLNEVENFITANNHLPNVPAAADIEKSGIALGEMQTKMMEKIEELTLYVIELKKEIEQLKKK